jgi:Skp family chaperone for outer membrane proteins
MNRPGPCFPPREWVPRAWVLRAAALALAWALLPAAPACAQTIRIGFVDSQRIFSEYKAAQEAQDRFGREIQAWRTEADDRRKAVDNLRNELKDQDPLLSESARLEKETALQKAVSDYDRFVQDFWGPNGKVQRLNDEMTREVISKVRDAVELLANRQGYDLVLDAADGNVIFGVKSLDLTQQVLDDLNKSDVTTTPK